jgi:hypothetical protein
MWPNAGPNKETMSNEEIKGALNELSALCRSSNDK